MLIDQHSYKGKMAQEYVSYPKASLAQRKIRETR